MWEDVHENIEKIFLKERLGLALNSLTNNQRSVLVLRYGLMDGICQTFSEIAKELKLSGTRISQIDQKGLRILRSSQISLDDFIVIRKPKQQTVVHQAIPSVFSMHPAFREANLYARKLPLLKKEEKRQKKIADRLKKLNDDDRRIAEYEIFKRKKQEELQRASQRDIALIIEEQKIAHDNHLRNISNSYTDYDRWYEKQFGRKLSESF
jgi:RNA polymerase sporulation-specific sigma factor